MAQAKTNLCEIFQSNTTDLTVFRVWRKPDELENTFEESRLSKFCIDDSILFHLSTKDGKIGVFEEIMFKTEI